MNPRIRELAFKSAGGMLSYDEDGFVLSEKEVNRFAELIVKECCEVLEQTEDALDRQKWPTPRGCVEYIKDHFGVEE